MRFTHFIKLVSAFVCLVIFSVSSTAGVPKNFPPTTCNFTILGTSGKLFCNFNVNLRETKHDFQVQRYDLDFNNEDPDRVLFCYWRHPENLTCTVNRNYLFSGHVSDEAVLEIPKVTKETEGRYLCHMIPPDAEMEYCVVSLSAPNLDRRPVPPTESTSGRPTQPVSNVGQTVPSCTPRCEQDTSSTSQTFLVSTIVLAVAVGVVLMIGIAIGLFLSCRWNLHMKAKKFLSIESCHKSEEQEIIPEQQQPLKSTPQSHSGV